MDNDYYYLSLIHSGIATNGLCACCKHVVCKDYLDSIPSGRI